jgi:hypothetical protein
LKQNLPLPKAIANAPELELGLEFVYKAFWELSSCRQCGFGIGYIPWPAIAEYAAFYGLEADEFDDFVYQIRAMDKAYVQHHVPDDNPKTTSKKPRKK